MTKTPQTTEQAREIIAEMRAKTSRKAAIRFCEHGLSGLGNWSDAARREWVSFHAELTA